jgi:hypothetical protein
MVEPRLGPYSTERGSDARVGGLRLQSWLPGRLLKPCTGGWIGG